MGLIYNLNAWENISLAAAYHRKPPVAHRQDRARGSRIARHRPARFLARVPDELGTFERKMVAFARLIAGPELAVIIGLGDGLSRAECARVARFEQNTGRHPAGTLLFVDIREG